MSFSPSAPDDNDIVFVSALRTPLCRSRKGSLASVTVNTLVETVLNGVLQQTQVDFGDIQDICVGNVLLPANGFATFRMSQLTCMSDDTTDKNGESNCPLYTVNRQCASGLQAIANLANRIAVHEISIGIAVGVESMSNTPMTSIAAPEENRLIDNYANLSKSALDCLLPMGVTSDTLAKEFKMNRDDIDEFAVQSHHKAAAAQQNGKFDSEIVPVGSVCADDGIRPNCSRATLGQLRPLFSPNGSTTAGNSSQTTDGAAAVMVMSRKVARQRQLPIRAKWIAYQVVGVPPRLMGMGPALAIPAVLKAAQLTINDIAVFEINEAFASQALWCCQQLQLPMHKVNPCGGAIALGHPLGCTGARLVATLIPELERREGGYGIVSMCIGTGMGAAALIYVEPRAKL